MANQLNSFRPLATWFRRQFSKVAGMLVIARMASAQPLDLELKQPTDNRLVEVRLRGALQSPTPTELRLMRSPNLSSWSPVGQKIRVPGGPQTIDIIMAQDPDSQGFYRVSSRETSFAATDGPEVLGYQSSFDDQIEALGNFSVGDFASRFTPKTAYLPGISWDPTQSLYWQDFQKDLVKNGPHWFSPPVSLRGLKLSDNELAMFRTNGFVVSEQLAEDSFGDLYYGIFERDLPVFVTTDSILHAWYRSFSAVLEVVEEGHLRGRLRELLLAMRNGLQAESTLLEESTEDAAYLLGVAVRLCSLPGEFVPEAWPVDPFDLQDDPERWLRERRRLDRVARRIDETLGLIQAAKPSAYQFFDAQKTGEIVDFSQFIPRGHYTKSPALQRYFQAMMWLGRVDFRVAGDSENASNRQLGTTLVLNDLLTRSEQRKTWEALDRFISTFFGPADSMDFRQLDALLKAEGLTNLVKLTSWDPLERLRRKIEDGTLGTQAVGGHLLVAGAGGDQVRWPRSFTVLGQRFSVDSWALGQTVMDRIVEPGSNPRRLVRRRRPYSLDVAFSVFGNNHVVPELVANMTRPDGEPFRDGFPYQRNLAAVRMTLDARPAEAWTSTLYDRWLQVLRSLSAPTTGPEYPEAMRTRAWAMKTVNTQLASWTQLRHASVLYVKQSVTPPILCQYPAGFVEPVPEFFREMGLMARQTADALQTLALPDQFRLQRGEMILPNPTEFFREFSNTCGTLEAIATAELNQQPLSLAQATFLKDVIQRTVDGYFGIRNYSGWYPRLFYWGKNVNGTPSTTVPIAGQPLPLTHDSVFADFLVTDVHTDGPSAPDQDPGAVLHEGIGRVNLLMIAVDNGPDRMVFAGPVFSQYEFNRPFGERLTDEQWKESVTERTHPKPPPWTRSYLVPKP